MQLIRGKREISSGIAVVILVALNDCYVDVNQVYQMYLSNHTLFSNSHMLDHLHHWFSVDFWCYFIFPFAEISSGSQIMKVGLGTWNRDQLSTRQSYFGETDFNYNNIIKLICKLLFDLYFLLFIIYYIYYILHRFASIYLCFSIQMSITNTSIHKCLVVHLFISRKVMEEQCLHFGDIYRYATIKHKRKNKIYKIV